MTLPVSIAVKKTFYGLGLGFGSRSTTDVGTFLFTFIVTKKNNIENHSAKYSCIGDLFINF